MTETHHGRKQRFLSSVEARSVKLDGLPTEVTIEITSRCQLACLTCPRETLFKDLVHNREMEWELFERLARRYVPHLDYLDLAGGLGEPLLYSRFADAVKLARSLNPDAFISLCTNACLPRTVRALEPVLGDLTELRISIDAVEDEFERIVGQAGVWPKFRRIVGELIPLCEKNGTRLRFNSVVTPENFAGMPAVVSTLAEWGGRSLFVNGMNLAATDIGLDRYDFYVTDEYAEAMTALVEQGRRHGIEVDWHDQRTITGFESCKAPWNNFYIAWNGLLAACCAKPFPELLNFGHVENPNLEERINDEGLIEFRRLSLLNQSPDFCRSCGAQHRAYAKGSTP
ncbi:hypothetical protein GCM10010517_05600 [Streptosporangium fragile]|uniref:Radical SAM protein n=1 Tax=Streptosporangium fragile TaxID=46186 RepID=A0ABP6I628_9ACTN